MMILMVMVNMYVRLSSQFNLTQINKRREKPLRNQNNLHMTIYWIMDTEKRRYFVYI